MRVCLSAIHVRVHVCNVCMYGMIADACNVCMLWYGCMYVSFVCMLFYALYVCTYVIYERLLRMYGMYARCVCMSVWYGVYVWVYVCNVLCAFYADVLHERM